MKRIFTLVFLLISGSCFPQERCFQCERDSLRALLHKASTDSEKQDLLKKIVTTQLIVEVNDFDSTKTELSELVELGEQNKLTGIEAYRAWKEAYEASKRKDFATSLEKYKMAVILFDQSKTQIPCIIGHLRNIYTNLNMQEEKFKFYQEKIKQYQLNGPPENLAAAYHGLANYYNINAEYGLAISNYLKAGDIFKRSNPRVYRSLLGVVADVYTVWGNKERAARYSDERAKLAKQLNETATLRSMAFSKAFDLKDYKQALILMDSSMFDPRKSILPAFRARLLLQCASIFLALKRDSEAYNLLDKIRSLVDSAKVNFTTSSGSVEVDYGFYEYYMAKSNFGSAEKYLLEALRKAVASDANNERLKYLQELAQFYANQKQFDKAYSYSSKFISLTHLLDSIKNRFNISPYEYERTELKQLDSIHTLKQAQAVQAATLKQNIILLWISLAAILIISLFLLFVYRQYQTNKRTLETLRKTQQQLILAEKMASLGELTAGIAHEIQNPLNFVNNFSEVNKELIKEIQDLRHKTRDRDEKLENEILNDIVSNSEKISHHGKRAGDIVKSMLQHSSSSSSQKELTDINSLCDEYLRLAYHGLRAKDKSFNAKLETGFDTTITKLNVVQQDMGRVILNLVNNAFYAASEKAKQKISGYEPTVIVFTKTLGNKVEIHVKDNGNGIPQKVVDKIFQPFFTTKPAGQGTGLGLSLSYDIVKAHGGEIKVETKEGEGSEFVIILSA